MTVGDRNRRRPHGRPCSIWPAGCAPSASRRVSDTSPSHILAASARRRLDTVPASTFKSRLLGVGVVMPGPFEIEGMSSVGPTTLPGWAGHRRRERCSARPCGEPVIVENDATAAAVGERLYRRRPDDLQLLHGLFRRRPRPWHHPGRRARSAAPSAMPAKSAMSSSSRAAGPALAASAAAWSAIASLHALHEKLCGAGIPDADVVDLAELHAKRHPVLLDWIAEAATYLAPIVAMLENILDPETIILGGALPDAIIDDLIERDGAAADLGRQPQDPRPAPRHARPDRAIHGGTRRRRPAAARGGHAKARNCRHLACRIARQTYRRT